MSYICFRLKINEKLFYIFQHNMVACFRWLFMCVRWIKTTSMKNEAFRCILYFKSNFTCAQTHVRIYAHIQIYAHKCLYMRLLVLFCIWRSHLFWFPLHSQSHTCLCKKIYFSDECCFCCWYTHINLFDFHDDFPPNTKLSSFFLFPTFLISFFFHFYAFRFSFGIVGWGAEQ